MQKKKILFIIPFLPYPMQSGGHQALYNGIAAVKDDYDVTVAYRATDDAEYRKAVEGFLAKLPNVKLLPLLKYEEPITLRYKLGWRAVALARWIFGMKDPMEIQAEQENKTTKWWKSTITPGERKWIEHISSLCKQDKYDIIQVEMPWIISSVFSLPKGAKTVYVHHELGFIRRELEMSQLDYCRDYAEAMRQFADFNEIGQLNMYDSIITLSPIDAEKLKTKGVSKPIYSSFAIIDTEPIDNAAIGDGKRLTFIGPDTHTPNLVGITWFLDNCWSRLRQLDPSITLDIIGKWKEERKQEYSAQYTGVHFLGFVDDLNVAIKGCTMIVPITVGSGIRMKILEASSKGVPFVSTTVGAEGIPVTDGKDCFLTDDPEIFVQDIIKLQNRDLRKQFIANAHQMVVANYSLAALRKNRLGIYNQILAK